MIIKLFQKEVTVKEEVVKEKPIVLKGRVNQEEHDLCLELELSNQAKIREIEDHGYKCLNPGDIEKALGYDAKKNPNHELRYLNTESFWGKIPFGILCKFKEAKESGLFEGFRVYYYAPSVDPILVGIINLGRFTTIDFEIGRWGDQPANE